MEEVISSIQVLCLTFQKLLHKLSSTKINHAQLKGLKGEKKIVPLPLKHNGPSLNNHNLLSFCCVKLILSEYLNSRRTGLVCDLNQLRIKRNN